MQMICALGQSQLMAGFDESGVPFVYAQPAKGGWDVMHCPYCGDWHGHGEGEGLRRAPCGGVYYLLAPPPDKIPEDRIFIAVPVSRSEWNAIAQLAKARKCSERMAAAALLRLALLKLASETNELCTKGGTTETEKQTARSRPPSHPRRKQSLPCPQ